LSARGKNNIEQNFALDLHLPAFIRVNRTGLKVISTGTVLTTGRRTWSWLRCCDYVGVSEAALANRAARTGNAGRTIASGDAAAKTSAGDDSLCACEPPVPLP